MFFNRKNTNLFFKFALLFLFLFLLKIIPFNTGFEDSIYYLNNIYFPISSHFNLNKDNKLKFIKYYLVIFYFIYDVLLWYNMQQGVIV